MNDCHLRVKATASNLGTGDLNAGKPAITHTETGYAQDYGSTYIGEMNDEDRPHGRGLTIDSDGSIFIGFWNNGVYAAGNYITLGSGGSFRLGEFYFLDYYSGLKDRYTDYDTDGSSRIFGY